jgi:hypothetical protein
MVKGEMAEYVTSLRTTDETFGRMDDPPNELNLQA